MTLGELIDMIREVERAEDAVASSELAIVHGGSEETMRRKRSVLSMDMDDLEKLRNRPIPIGEEDFG